MFDGIIFNYMPTIIMGLQLQAMRYTEALLV